MGKKKTGKSEYAFFEDVKNRNKVSKAMGLKEKKEKKEKAEAELAAEKYRKRWGN